MEFNNIANLNEDQFKKWFTSSRNGLPVQEMVYQLTDTEHLVYSPHMQTSTIICKNATSKIVHLDIATKILVPENCHAKFSKHTISSTFTSTISSPPFHFAWAWDPLTLPSTSLDKPQHLDHMVNELRKKFITYKQTSLTPLISNKCSQNLLSLSIACQLSSGSLWH
jgi:hypothetical protein